MKLFFATFFVFILVNHDLAAQDKRAYVIYNAAGKKMGYEKMVKKLSGSDIVLFGELHNNPIAHWLEYEVMESLNLGKMLILGAEMIEADNQVALSDYITGKITAKALDSLARLWPNYKTDYSPLVDFAKAHQLNFIATNIPRRYANLVYKKDFKALDSLSAIEKSWIAPLPIAYDPDLPCYAGMKGMMGGHSSETLPKAQAIKDATMAWFILRNYGPGKLFLHFHGAYHSDNHEGILWYLKKENPDLKYVTISTVSQKNPLKLEQGNKNKADFIICVDENMTSTY
jgi:uncharacterized iron-regulated protein